MKLKFKISVKITKVPIRTYRYPGGHQVTLVENEDEVFVRLFFLDVPLHLSAASPQGVSGIEDLAHHISGVNHLKNDAKKLKMTETLTHGY